MSNRYGTDATPDRPEFEIRVGGTAVDAQMSTDVMEIDVAEEIGRHGRLTLLVQNWDADTRSVRHSDDGPFGPGAEVEVLLGYHSSLQSVFDGVVVAVTTHFPATGGPVLRVEARSRSLLLDGRPRTRVYEDSTDADVAADLASQYGLTADSGDGVTRPFVVVDRRTDWEYLRGRAEQFGWVTYVRGTTLAFRPPAEAAEPPEFEYGLNLTELHLTEDLAGLSEASTVTAWDPEALEAVSSEAGPAQAEIDTGDRRDHAAALGEADWPGREDTAATSLIGAADEADLLAAGRQRWAALAHVTGTGSAVGNPALRCDSWITVVGVGSRMSGPLYLSAVRHRLSSRGYRTEFQVGLPPRLLPPAAATAPSAATARTAAAPGASLVIGIVEDADDPQGWGRVKVAFPWRADGGTAIWARLATLDAGPEQGTYFIPDVGQEVLVGFLDGEAAQPVVLGSLWNGTQEPPLSMTDGNPVRGLVTRSGHRLLFDDEDGASITVESAEGSSLVISDADGALTLTDSGSGNTITMSSSGIELSAAQGDIALKAEQGDVTIDGMSIKGKATGASSIESSATLEIKSSGTLGIKGALVQIN